MCRRTTVIGAKRILHTLKLGMLEYCYLFTAVQSGLTPLLLDLDCMKVVVVPSSAHPRPRSGCPATSGNYTSRTMTV